MPPALRLEGPVLLDAAGNEPVGIEAIVFVDEGVGVIRSAGDPARILPWSLVVAHVVEAWAGGTVPGRRPEPQVPAGGPPPHDRATSGVGTDNGGTALRTEAGSVIAIQSPYGTYRFFVPRADPHDLSQRITDFAVSRQGLSGVPPVTTVATPRRAHDRRQGPRSAYRASSWSKVRPYLVVALIVVVATVITLVLLQSAGTIHLPYLGGADSSGAGLIRIR